TDRAAICQGACSVGATGQVVVVESGNGLRTGAVEIDRAAGDRERVSAGSEGARDTDRAAICQGAWSVGATGQVVVVESGNGLRTGAVEINCAAGDRERVSAGSERASNTNSTAVCQRAWSGRTAGEVVVVKGGNGFSNRS